MRTVGLAWGAAAVVMAFGATAQAAPKGAAAAQGGSAGSAATAPSSASAAPPATDAPVAPAAPDASAPLPEAVTPPPAPPAAEAGDQNGAGADEDEEEERPRKRKRRGPRVIQRESEEEEESTPTEPEAPPPEQAWRLVGAGARFLVSAERITNVLGWSVTQTVPVSNFNGGSSFSPTSVDIERSGTDVSFLGSGGASTNVFGVPRVGLDGMFSNGLTLGGSLSYLVVSGKHETLLSGTNKATVDDPTTSLFIFAPRIGVIIPASPYVAVWLRAGISRISASSDQQSVDPQTGQALGATVTSTVTLVDLTLDPQLVITPMPHVGLTLGALIDIGATGTVEQTGSSETRTIKASSYGVTGGVSAIF